MRRAGLFALVLGVPLLMGTVAEQRNRLPPPPDAECRDPVSGTWMAHVFYEHVNQWYLFKLELDMDAEQQITGTIRSEWWDGDAKVEKPPECGPPHFRRAVFEPATGRFDGKVITLNATSWEPLRSHVCGWTRGNYLLDNFEGEVDTELQEFQSLLNADAPEWRDVPTVFRRVQCEPPDKEPDPVVEVPPPFQPPAPSVGCNLGW